MEVLSRKEEVQAADLGGATLIQTVVSLTELPEPLVHQEIDEILQASGHRSESLTLEQLRSAMVSYLEALQAEFVASEGDNLLTENDAKA
jgi:hypothetical protein